MVGLLGDIYSGGRFGDEAFKVLISFDTMPLLRGMSMRRRDFVEIVTAFAVTWPLATRAQPTNKVARSVFWVLRLPLAPRNR